MSNLTSAFLHLSFCESGYGVGGGGCAAAAVAGAVVVVVVTWLTRPYIYLSLPLFSTRTLNQCIENSFSLNTSL